MMQGTPTLKDFQNQDYTKQPKESITGGVFKTSKHWSWTKRFAVKTTFKQILIIGRANDNTNFPLFCDISSNKISGLMASLWVAHLHPSLNQ